MRPLQNPFPLGCGPSGRISSSESYLGNTASITGLLTLAASCPTWETCALIDVLLRSLDHKAFHPIF